MSWKKQRRLQGKNKYYSLSKKLRREERSNDEFEIMLQNLTLEEVISLKLELAARTTNRKLYGFNLWRSIPDITRCAVLSYANKATKSKMEAASFLGISMYEYYLYINRYLDIKQANIFKPKKWKR